MRGTGNETAQVQRLRLRHLAALYRRQAVYRLRRKAPAAIGKPPPPCGKEGREMVEVETDHVEVEQQADDSKGAGGWSAL